MVNFLGDTRIEKKKSVGDSFAIWPLRRYGSFFFSFFKYYNNWWLLMRYFSSFALSRDREPKSIPPFCSFTRLSCSNIVFINFFLFFANSYIYIFFNGSINYNCNTDWNELNNFVDFGEKKCFCQIAMGIQYFCIW